MANKTLNVRIQNKYDTEANWASKNPVLLKGEAAYSSDKNGLYKIGDGTSKWSDLKYNSANTLVNHTSGEGFEFGYANSKTITIPKTTAVTTYYIQIAQKANFRFKNYYVKTSGSNTQYSFQAEISANAYMVPHVTLNTQSYNNSEVKSILICKNSTNSYHHDIYLVVDSSTSVAKTIYIWSDNTILDTVSTTAPTTATELNVNIINDSYIYTSKKIQANIMGSAGSVAWGNITGKPSTYYTHPSYTARSSGLYKVTVDATGHVSGATAVSKADITALGIPGSDTNTWRGIQNNLTSTATDQSLSAAQGKILNETKTTRHDWNTTIKCATWSRLCYVPYNKSVVGSSFLLNIRGTRNAVVYNDTFMIKAHHSSRGNITKISGCNYSIVSIRIVCDSSGNCYVEFLDSANGATNATTQTVYCTLIEVAVGSITKYTSFTNGTTLPTNFTVAATLTTNTNSLQGNLTWDEITGKPTTFTPSSHTHDDRYYTETEINNKLAGYLPLAGGAMTGTIKHGGAGQWIKDRNNVAILGTATSKDSYNPVIGQYTPSGCWTIGNLASNEYLYFNYTTNANYAAGTNNSVRVTLPNQDGTIITSATIGSQSVASAAKVNDVTAQWSGQITTTNWFAAFDPTVTNVGKIRAISPANVSTVLGLQNYLPLSGGTMTGTITVPSNGIVQNQQDTSNYTIIATWKKNSTGWYYDKSGTSTKYKYDPHIGQHNTGGSGKGAIAILPTPTDADPWGGTVGLYVSDIIMQYYGKRVPNTGNISGTVGSSAQPVYISNGTITAITGTINNNAATATKLQTARSINGTSFDGSGNITTAKWGTARTLSLTGSVTGSVSIDGSGNVSLATTTNHTHSQYYDSGVSRTANTVLAAPNGANGSATFRALVAADIPTLTKSKISDFPTSLAPTAGSNNYVRVYNSKDIGNSSTVTFNDLAKQHFAMGMINGATDNPYGAAKWAHGISMAWANGANTSWISQIALGVQEGTGMWYRARQGTIVGVGWTRVLDSSNYTSYAATKGHTHDLSTMINTLSTGTAAPTDADYYVTQYAGGGTTTTSYHRRPHSALWTYIKGKADTVYQPKGSYAAANHTHSYLPLSGGTMNGNLFLANGSTYYINNSAHANFRALGTAENTYIPFPQGGGFRTTVSVNTGYLKITLPQSWSSTMMSFKVKIYEYRSDTSCEYTISGYNYTAGSTWTNCTACSIGKNDTKTVSNLAVRFGHDGSKCAVYIGEADTKWNYVQVQVCDIVVGYTNYEYSKWASGWSVGFTTTLGTITQTKTNPNVSRISTAYDIGNGNGVTFAYSKSGMNYADYTWLAGWNGYELRAVAKSQFATAGHTHNYAGSSSAGGAATSANKLNTNAGSATQPVYFSNGIPVACTYTLGKSVPADAKFTDTNTKVTQTAVGSSGYTNWRTVPWGASNSGTEGFTPTTVTDTMFSDPNLTYQPSSGTLRTKIFKGSLSGNATSANKLATARTISLGTGVTSTATSFDGTGNITIPVNNINEAYLSWGGRNFAGTYGPLDAAMIPDLGANRLAFGKPDGVTVQYSRDGGSTWTDYGASSSSKLALLSSGESFNIGKADNANKATANTDKYMLRIILDTDKLGTYTVLNKFALYVSTNGSNSCWCTIDASLESTPTTWVNFANKVSIAGWAGWNIININPLTTYGNTKATQYGLIRLTFGANGGSTTYIGLQINRIMAFGGMGWNVPSNMAKNGHLYSYDRNQNATFPGAVSATSFNGNIAWANVSGKPAIVGKTIKSLTSASASGWTNLENAQTLIPDMSVIAYWNGAYSGTSSNLAYCNKGAFGTIVTKNTSDYATAGHTHKYAGSGSAGGSATSAVKLDTSTAGSATQPVYFTGGKPVACTYTLGKSVPSNAVFTDTNNKMTQTAITSKDYTNWRTILWGASNSGTEGFAPTTVTDGAFTDTNLSYQPSTGTLRAKVFKGALFNGTTVNVDSAGNTSELFFKTGKSNTYSIVNSNSYNQFGIIRYSAQNKYIDWPFYITNSDGQCYFKNSSKDISNLASQMLPPVLTDGGPGSGAGSGRVLSIASNVDAKIIKFRIFTSSSATTATTVNVTYSTSDIRLKDNVKDTDIKDALSVINKMKIRQFDWKDDNKHQKIGFVADELEELDDKLVVGGGWEDEEHTQMNVKGVDTFYMMGYVVKGMQELSEQIKALTEENKELKKQIEGLKREG